MKSSKITDVKITITLSDIEAKTLMQLIQNPLIDNESEKITLLRELLWNVLEEQGINVR